MKKQPKVIYIKNKTRKNIGVAPALGRSIIRQRENLDCNVLSPAQGNSGQRETERETQGRGGDTGGGGRDREKGGREREKKRDRQTGGDKQRDRERETERETQRERQRQRDREKDRPTQIQTQRHRELGG